jgi:hypothetical protein
MEQKDFILREIEKISVMLQYLIGKFLPSKTIHDQQTTENLINIELKEKYGNDLDYILNLNQSEFDAEFNKNKGFTFENIELLADLLFTIGNDEINIRQEYLEKALQIYTYIDKKSKTFSFERTNKMNSIHDLIS